MWWRRSSASTQPGLLIAGADSHTTTHGAFGCLAFGIGASDALHVLATQALWRGYPKLMRIAIDGALSPHVSAKDLILAIIARIGVGGGIDMSSSSPAARCAPCRWSSA